MNSLEQSEFIQKQRQEIAVIREEVDSKLDNLQESLKVNEKTFLEMIILESSGKLNLIETIKKTIPQTEDNIIALSHIDEVLQGFVQMHKDGSTKIEQIIEGAINDFNRIKTDMLISVDVSLRSLEKRLKKYEERFKSIEEFEKSLGSFNPKEVVIQFTDGEEIVDGEIIQNERCLKSYFAKYIAFKPSVCNNETINEENQMEEKENGEDDVVEEKQEDDGEKKIIRINRSKELFKYVFMFLRDGIIVCNEKSLSDIQAIIKELKAYGVCDEDIFNSMKQCINAFILSHNDLTIKEICSTIEMEKYEELFVLEKTRLDCEENEKVLIDKILMRKNLESIRGLIKDLALKGEIQIEKLHKKELINFVISSLPKREIVEFKISNANMNMTGTTITNKLHKQFNVAMVPEQVSSFTAKIGATGRSGICNAMYVGFTYATPDTIPVGQQWVKMGYYMSIYNGNLYSEKITPNTPNHQYYNNKITIDDSVVCWYSKEEKTIGFIINGIPLKPAFTGIVQSELYPIVVMYEADQAFILDSFIPHKLN